MRLAVDCGIWGNIIEVAAVGVGRALSFVRHSLTRFFWRRLSVVGLISVGLYKNAGCQPALLTAGGDGGSIQVIPYKRAGGDASGTWGRRLAC
jgi:hypothetical protein